MKSGEAAPDRSGRRRTGGSRRDLPSQNGVRYPVRAGIARHHDPVAATLSVIPVLAHRACEIVAQINVVVEVFVRSRPHGGGVAAIDELVEVAFAAIGAGNAQLGVVLSEDWVGRPGPFRRSGARSRTGRGETRSRSRAAGRSPANAQMPSPMPGLP